MSRRLPKDFLIDDQRTSHTASSWEEISSLMSKLYGIEASAATLSVAGSEGPHSFHLPRSWINERLKRQVK